MNKQLETGKTYVVRIKCLDQIGKPVEGYNPSAGEMNFIRLPPMLYHLYITDETKIV